MYTAYTEASRKPLANLHSFNTSYNWTYGIRLYAYVSGRYPEILVLQLSGTSGVTCLGNAETTHMQFIQTEVPASEVTLRLAWAAYQETRKLKESTKRHYSSRINNQLMEWLDVPLIHITEDDIQERHHYITHNNGPAIANSTMRTLRAIIRFAQFKYRRQDRSLLIQVNPVQQLNELRAWNEDNIRTRIVAAGQMHAWHQGVMRLNSHVARDLLLLLMFTGMRWEEAAELRWEEVDMQQGIITLEKQRCKNGKQHVVPFTNFVWRLIWARNNSKVSPWVFPNVGYTGPVSSATKACYYVHVYSGVQFTPHDLRRSFCTIADDLEIPKEVSARLVNHKLDIHDNYVVPSTERLRRVSQRITNAMLHYMKVC